MTRSRMAVAALAGTLALGALAGGIGGARADTDIMRIATAGGQYHLLLNIESPAVLTANKKVMGEFILGGARPTCTYTGRSTRPAAKNACTHHVELQVSDAHSKKTVMHATVAITLRNDSTHAQYRVPIMRMVMSGLGMADMHYGNNVRVPNGTYTVLVRVNGKSVSFQQVKLDS